MNNPSPGQIEKKAQPIQKLADTRKEREGSEKVRIFPKPSAPKLSLVSTTSREMERETKSQEKNDIFDCFVKSGRTIS